MERNLQSVLEESQMTFHFIKRLLTAKWLWITVFGCIGVKVLVFPVVYVYLELPSWVKVVALICLLSGSGVVAGLRDFSEAK